MSYIPQDDLVQRAARLVQDTRTLLAAGRPSIELLENSLAGTVARINTTYRLILRTDELIENMRFRSSASFKADTIPSGFCATIVVLPEWHHTASSY
jgi:hypothetical protein